MFRLLPVMFLAACGADIAESGAQPDLRDVHAFNAGDPNDPLIELAHPVRDRAVARRLLTPAVDDRFELADAVFLGRVVCLDNRMSEASGDQPALPFTFVTWQIESAWKGVAAGEQLTARFLGGVNPAGEIVFVSEAPNFQQGDRDVVFLDTRSEAAFPIVGGAHGRYRILEGGVYDEDGRSLVENHEGDLAFGGARAFPELDVLDFDGFLIERQRYGGRGDVGNPGMAEAEFVAFLNQRVGISPSTTRAVSRDPEAAFVFLFGAHHFNR